MIKRALLIVYIRRCYKKRLEIVLFFFLFFFFVCFSLKNLKLIFCLDRMYMAYCHLQQKNSFLFLTKIFIVKQMKQQWGPFLGRTLANDFLFHHEKEWLNSSSIELKPKLYNWDTGVIFVMSRPRDHFRKFVNYMNTKHTPLYFLHLKQKIKIVFQFQI